MRKMKVLYVGDWRDSRNFGGRGQSIALHQLLAQRFEISGIIPGESLLSAEAVDGYVGTLLPQRYFRFVWRIRHKLKLADWYLKLVEEPFGARDFITDQPAQSAESALRYRATNPGLDELCRQVEQADVLVINGEGCGIFRTPFRRDFFFNLAMIELGVRLGKKVIYANAIISDCPVTGRNAANFAAARAALAKADGVLVRDPESLEYLQKEMPEVKAEYIPDALFTWFPVYQRFGASVPPNGDFVIGPPELSQYLGKLDFSKPYICLGGSATAADFQQEATECYVRLANALRRLGYPVYLTENCGGDRFLPEVGRITGCGVVPWNTPAYMAGAILANASLFVSGRFHATILASLGGTPCVFLGTHSHKMASLQRTLEYQSPRTFEALPSAQAIEEIVTLSEHYLRDDGGLRDRLQSVAERRCREAATLPGRIMEIVDGPDDPAPSPIL
jgi:hypothetical protein